MAGLWLVQHPPDFGSVWRELAGALRSCPAVSFGDFTDRHLVSGRALLVFLAVTSACRFAGIHLFAWIGLPGRRRRPPRRRRVAEPRTKAWLPALCAGWGVAGTIGFGLGACGLFAVPLLAPAVIGAALLGAGGLVAAARTTLLELVRLWRTAGPGGKACALLVATLAAGQAVAALAPETEVDSLIYHLPIAERALSSGRLVPMADNAPFHLSALSELLRAIAMGLGGEPAARLFGPAATLLTVLWLAAGVGARTGASWGWCAAALFVSAEPIIGFGIGCKPDALIAPFALAAVRLFGEDARWRSRRRAIAAGWMLGTAVAMKYLAGALLLAVAGVIVVGGGSLGLVASVVAGAAASLLPWLIKSWLLTGNPVFPAGHHLLGGLELTAASAANLQHAVSTVTLHASYITAWERLCAPWSISLVDGAPPGWLALLPLVLLARSRHAGWRWPAVALGFLVVWALGPVQIRFLIPVLPLLAWLGAEGLAATPRAGATLAAALIAIQVGGTAASPGLVGSLPVGLGLEDRGAYFRRRLPQWADALEAMRRLPVQARVVCLGSDTAYPLVRPLLVASRYQPMPAYGLLRASADPGALWRRMRQLNVTHVLHNPVAAIFQRGMQSVHPWTVGDVAVWESMWRGHAREVYRSPRMSNRHGWFVLYALRSRPQTPPDYGFLPGIEGVLACIEADIGSHGDHAGLQGYRRLEPFVGRYGAVRYFHARMLRRNRPREALDEIRVAERAGYRDPALYDDVVMLAEQLGEPGLAAAARAARAAQAMP